MASAVISWDNARDSLVAAARAGEPAALRQAWVMAEANRLGHYALPLLWSAARAGDAVAMVLLGERLWPKSRHRDAARYWLIRAAGQHPLAALRVKQYNVGDGPTEMPEGPAVTEALWSDLAKAALLPPRRIAKRRLRTTPDIIVVRGLFQLAECQYLQALSARLLRVSDVVDPETGKPKIDPYRTGLIAQMVPPHADIITATIDHRLAEATETDVDQGEPLAVLVYRKGEQYKPHWDHLVDTMDERFSRLKVSGQRLYTALVTLDDNFAGGETAFTDIGLKVKGRTGDALIFRNLDAAGKPDPLTMHAGLPIRGGVKWLASKWIRERPFVL